MRLARGDRAGDRIDGVWMPCADDVADRYLEHCYDEAVARAARRLMAMRPRSHRDGTTGSLGFLAHALEQAPPDFMTCSCDAVPSCVESPDAGASMIG